MNVEKVGGKDRGIWGGKPACFGRGRKPQRMLVGKELKILRTGDPQHLFRKIPGLGSGEVDPLVKESSGEEMEKVPDGKRKGRTKQIASLT